MIKVPCVASVLGYDVPANLAVINSETKSEWRVLATVSGQHCVVDYLLDAIARGDVRGVGLAIPGRWQGTVKVQVQRVARIDVDHWEASLLGIGPCPV